MKQIIKKILNKLGLNISKINPEISNLTFDQVYQNHLAISKNPVIFDVGANEGQSISRFKKIYPGSIIHSFEPSFQIFQKLSKNFGGDQNIFLNNFALGGQDGQKKFNVAKQSGASSFNKFQPKTRWIKKRSTEFGTNEENFTDTEIVNIKTLDNYCDQKKIKLIDILKIDTQGYEDEVLKGAETLINNNCIAALEMEIIFDDVYQKNFSFYDLEKLFIKKNFRLCGIDFANNNLFSGIVFFANALYINKYKIRI